MAVISYFSFGPPFSPRPAFPILFPSYHATGICSRTANPTHLQVRRVTGVIEIDREEERFLGIEASFWIAVALTYLDFLEDREVRGPFSECTGKQRFDTC